MKNKVNIHQTVWNNVESPFSENNNDLIVCKDSLNPGKIFNTNLTKEHEGFHPKYKTDEDNYLFQRSQELNKTVRFIFNFVQTQYSSNVNLLIVELTRLFHLHNLS